MDLVRHAHSTIPQPQFKRTTVHKDTNTWGIVDTILIADSKLSNKMCEFSKAFSPTYEGLRQIWKFVHDNIKYVADKPGLEEVKDPTYTWEHRFGDCKSFSLFIASILKCLHIPYRYRFAVYKGQDPTHVYVVAKLKSRTIILDSTIDQFDKEVPYLKKIDKMTQVDYLHGTIKPPAIKTRPATPSIKERIADAPKSKKNKSFINYFGKTQGELTLMLLDEQIKIAKAFYGDPNGYYQQAENLIFQRQKNPHTSLSNITGTIDPRLNKLMQWIDYARSQTSFAGFSTNIAKLNGTLQEDQAIIRKYCEFVQIQVNQLAKGLTPKKQDGSIWDKSNLIEEKKKCDDQLFFIDVFNSHLEKSGHHVLYEHLTGPTTPRAEAKKLNHELTHSVLAKNSQINRENIVLWVQNGIMRENANVKGLNGIEPKHFIDALRNADPVQPKIGVAFAVLAPVLIAAIGFVSEMARLIAAKRGGVLNELRGLGTEHFGPEHGDLTPGQTKTENSTDLNSMLPLILGGGAALLLLNK